jgi:hypothetical protein
MRPVRLPKQSRLVRLHARLWRDTTLTRMRPVGGTRSTPCSGVRRSQRMSPVMGDLPVGKVGTAEVLVAVEPIWRAKPETASRVRGRIEAILDGATIAAIAGGNPLVGGAIGGAAGALGGAVTSGNSINLGRPVWR